MRMTVEAILDQFANSEDIPETAIADAVAQREACLPVFRRILQAAARRTPMSERDRRAIFYIVHVLADMDARDAFPDIIGLLTARGVDAEELLAESMLYSLGRLLVSLFDGDLSRLEALIESPVASELAVAASVDALVSLAASGEVTRDAARAILDGLPERRQAEPGNAVWPAWATAIAVLRFEDLFPQVEAALSAREFDPGDGADTLMTQQEFLSLCGDAAIHGVNAEWLDSIGIGRFQGTVAEMRDWPAPDDAAPLQPIVNPLRHVGRNDPCPCGSGRKFKKCCGATA